MSRLIRFLSRRRTGRGIHRTAAEESAKQKLKKNILVCQVQLLDNTDVSIDVPVSMTLFS